MTLTFDTHDDRGQVFESLGRTEAGDEAVTDPGRPVLLFTVRAGLAEHRRCVVQLGGEVTVSTFLEERVLEAAGGSQERIVCRVDTRGPLLEWPEHR